MAEALSTDMERKIRENLESSGQYGKMRSMIIEAALQSLVKSESTDAAKLFLPSGALNEAKGSESGQLALAVVAEYLNFLGLQYTSSVFQMETSMPSFKGSQAIAAALSTTTPAALMALVDRGADGGAHRETTPSTSSFPTAKPTKPKSPSTASQSSEVTSEEGSDAQSHSSETPARSKESPSEDEATEAGEDTTYFISKWSKRSFMRKSQVTGQQVQLEYLNDCTVVVLDPLDSMTVDDCTGGELVIAACEGSVFLRNCKNMTVHVACKQLRTRDCENMDLHIFTTTDPVVEMSHHMVFRPFHLRLPSLRATFQAARLNPALNRFVHVYDFTADDTSLPKPHFTVLYPDHEVQMVSRYAEHGEPECPQEVEDLLSGCLLPAASSESGQNKSYDIKSGAKLWTASAAVTTEAASPSSESPTVRPPVPSAPTPGLAHETTGRPPAAPISKTVPPLSDVNQEEYSSFDDNSEGSASDDKYKVEEDDDDF